MKLEHRNTPLADLKVIQRHKIDDERGSFSRLFCAKQLAQFGWPSEMLQSNFSFNRDEGIVRGLHFQLPPHAEAKLVTCISGAVLDVAVDLRAGSSSYGHWFGTELNEANHLSMLIPAGFAHGYQVLEANSSLVYFHSAAYYPEFERGICWDDPTLSIDWPLPVKGLSLRDQTHMTLKTLGKGLVL